MLKIEDSMLNGMNIGRARKLAVDILLDYALICGSDEEMRDYFLILKHFLKKVQTLVAAGKMGDMGMKISVSGEVRELSLTSREALIVASDPDLIIKEMLKLMPLDDSPQKEESALH